MTNPWPGNRIAMHDFHARFSTVKSGSQCQSAQSCIKKKSVSMCVEANVTARFSTSPKAL